MSSSQLTGTAVLDRLREIQRQKQVLEVEELGLIALVEREHLAHDLGAKSTVVLLRDALKIGANDAAGRVKLALAITPPRLITGELVAPQHPQTAAALSAGLISTRAAAIVVKMTDKIDDLLADQSAPLYETTLLQFAAEHDPDLLGRFANGLYARVGQDGAFRDFETAHRRRDLAARRRPDGAGPAGGEFTSELHEYLEITFDTFGRPQPGPNGEPDPRTPGQRRHDALLEALKLLYASGTLPTVNGCATTLVLTATVDDYASGTGIVRTAHGYSIPVAVADRWLDPKAKAILVLLSKTKKILAYSDQQRLFTEQQRLAMYARDKGCSYPGCDAPLSWTHITSPTMRSPEERVSTTAPSSAGRTTRCSSRWAGSRSRSTRSRTGSHPPGSTRNRSRAATGCTTPATDQVLKHAFQRYRTFQRGLPDLSLRSDRTENANSTLARLPSLRICSLLLLLLLLLLFQRALEQADSRPTVRA